MNTKVFIFDEKDPQDIIHKRDIQDINNAFSVLIQVFSGETSEKIERTLNYLFNTFSKAVIITASTDGEIANDKVLTSTTVVAISTFENTQLHVAYTDMPESFAAGEELAKKVCTPDTKLLISFANGLKCNGEEFLNGIYSIAPQVTIAGGLTGDNARFERCFVGVNNILQDKGAVAVSLNSKTLQVNNLYSFGWQTIGLKHTITKAKQNRVYTIDGISAVAFYKKYLGNDVASFLPNTGIEFPLVIEDQGFKKARAITAKHEDGSLSFAGNVPEGTTVYLGIGEAERILSNPLKRLHNFNVESFFIYSCMARRRFLPQRINEEMKPFASIAPTSGFFTYGEFYTHTKPELLNQTLTAVALSESGTVSIQPQIDTPATTAMKDRTFQALRHILDVTSEELHSQTLLQQKVQNELEAKTATLQAIQEMANLGNWELDLKSMQMFWSHMNYKIFNLDADKGVPTFLELFHMVALEDRKKLLKVRKKLLDGQIHSTEIKMRRPDGRMLYILTSGKMVFNENKAIKIIGTILDLTEIRMQDNIMIQQSKAAQMGEMINMIAHQWRQPLNAISAASIKLNMQNDMGILTEKEITATSQFIEDMTQKMSQTINDFMNFTKPTNQKENIIFAEVLQEILNIMGPQLKNHDISFTIDLQQESELFTYKKELEHIIMNIIANARDAFENTQNEEKLIHLQTFVKNNLFVIKIADNAGGIEDALIDRIFEPYFTTKETNKGTGLGLYMSKKILQEHLNGDIFVQNTKDGAEFSIILDIENE